MSRAFLAAAALALLSGLSLGAHAAPQQPANPPAGEVAAAATARAGAVNVNTADVDTLSRELKGIGTSKARAIVAYREEHGPFSSLDELLEVKGIGSAILENNRSKLSLQ